MEELLKLVAASNPTLFACAAVLVYVLPKLTQAFYQSRVKLVEDMQDQISRMRERAEELDKKIDELESESDTWRDKYYKTRDELEFARSWEKKFIWLQKQNAKKIDENIELRRELIKLQRALLKTDKS